jgi:UDP-N-acetylmuramyl pentapeptide phosphotransferase/UDP-N-acetylglucosamine-1-phosphate transferase
MDAVTGIQKVHRVPTPRVGGVGIYLALLLARGVLETPARHLLDTILLAGLPALGAGLIEDVTHRAGISLRMMATVCSGLLATWISGVSVTHLSIPGVDALLAAGPLAVLFTAFAIGGVANAINIIDGFHGLASGATTIALVAIAAVAFAVGDNALAILGLVLIAAIAGFWLVNFPWGKLFLGDGGAYFAGFALAWMAVLLPMRNASVSPWASLLICCYPVIEALYSIARRWLKHQSPSQADCRHLHSLIASRIVQRQLSHMPPYIQNSGVSVLMWGCAAIPAFLGVTFYAHTTALALCAAACLLLYHCLYSHVART